MDKIQWINFVESLTPIIKELNETVTENDINIVSVTVGVAGDFTVTTVIDGKYYQTHAYSSGETEHIIANKKE